MAFEEVSLEDLVKKAHATNVSNKTYRLTEKTHPGGEIYEVTILATAEEGQKTYAAEEILSIYNRDEELIVDKKGLPYLLGTLGPIPYKRHDTSFLGNHSFAEAMSGLHQEKVFCVLNEMKQKKHPAYDEFLRSVDEVIVKLPDIKEAYDLEYYKGDKNKLKKYSFWERKAFKYLTAKKMYSLEDYKSRNHAISGISLQQKQHVDGISGKTKEEALFLHWYVDYLEKNNYPDTNDYKPLYAALAKWRGITEDKLKQAGFVRS